MKRICIVGGSGFVGNRLISILCDEAAVLNIDKAPSATHAALTHKGDVREPSSFARHFIDQDTVVLLAAEHRDDVSPTSLYYDVNVQGMRNVLDAMDANNVRNIVFTSSVAIYGLNQPMAPTETSPEAPFNHYGKSKWAAEQVLQEWAAKGEGRNALVIRPTVIFGEQNRGNVFNLLKQIYSGNFFMIGNGRNRKSMAYVGNIVGFIKYKLDSGFSGVQIYNYVDKPDFDMNTLVNEIYRHKGKSAPKFRIPYPIGIFGGYCFDLLSKITAKNLPISSIRVKKFCSSTEINSDKLDASGFQRPVDLKEALQSTLSSEFVK
ncbi:MAG: NAD-dependent epimerase/dehydratase family protein [Verrucomicrobiota bacterium]|nr:NAD-dependent epimerase/dehydratase family protein [Verrucomicrobiota bacterium]MEC8650130.1 NAD-dependent epimerase/dehydratase family protein [Verrucomicrobiota bacterium]